VCPRELNSVGMDNA